MRFEEDHLVNTSPNSVNTSANAAATPTDTERATRALSVLDRAVYALFSRHADSDRHDADRKRYRATAVSASFDVYLSRTYGLSWLVFALVAGWTFVVMVALPDTTMGAAADFLQRGVPGLETLSFPAVSRPTAAVAVAQSR